MPFRIPPTAVGGWFRFTHDSTKLRTVWILPKNSNKVAVTRVAATEMPDLNNPPTAVRGIRIHFKSGAL